MDSQGHGAVGQLSEGKIGGVDELLTLAEGSPACMAIKAFEGQYDVDMVLR